METVTRNHNGHVAAAAAAVAARNAPILADAQASHHSTEDIINPRAHKRRRADSRTSVNSIAAADHQELADLYSQTGLSYNAGPAALPLQLQIATNNPIATRHVSNAPRAVDSVDMGGLYTYAHDKMAAQGPHSPALVKYENDLGYGPYHAQYWSFVQRDLNGINGGTPYLGNGGYQSPYATLASVPYFPEDEDAQLGLPGDMNQNDYPGANEDMFSRQTQFHSMAPDESNVYPSPVDNFSWQYPAVEPVPQMHSLPVLENVATQILSMISANSVHDFAGMVNNPDSVKGQAYSSLEALFEQTKKNFAPDQLFIDPSTIQHHTPESVRIIRRTNIATFALCVFRGRDVPFLDLNEAFFDIFMPAGTRLYKTEGALLLELKTQAYIAVMLSTDLAKDDVLDELFPRDLQLTILRRRPEPTHLAPSEQDFISRINTRRQYLIAGSDDMDALTQLPQKYSWIDFLEEVRVCVGRGLDNRKNSNPVLPSATIDDPIRKATLAAHAAISGHSPIDFPNAFDMPTLEHTPCFSDESHTHKRKRTTLSDSSRDSSSISPKTPTAPMQNQYEQARAITHPKTTPFSNRRSGTPSQRRPWTQNEEKALMDGLDRVKGPHWSQILALYGTGGSLSEILKDRNQVQLKDKARNLKLFFLKSAIEVPAYLQRVTGELKTRAPAQAAKMEARERLKALEDENGRRRSSSSSGMLGLDGGVGGVECKIEK